MAFGITRQELRRWKQDVNLGNIAFLTHYWIDPRFPDCNTVTKVGCQNVDKLAAWGKQYGLKKEWIDHYPNYPHYDLFGETQKRILVNEQKWDQIKHFKL
ncbi:hypothetical protein [Virgibacillus oceani]|uniref:YneQ n=1 Tax=Virgibacillus oceani TaxID=1479511 RepID=A0A917HGL0_9BACI|nr:hypothetical protein [Virgibacillus oceani]GGG77845.1 hypothetical protein GCM10011398_23810 [Virgibacillus oceani]